MVTQSNALLPLHDAAKLFPQNNGKHPHVITIRRWILRGSRGVKLAGSRVGGQWYTSADAVNAFIQAGTDKAMLDHGRTQSLPLVASAEHAAAMEALKGYGLHAGRNKRNSTASVATSEAMPDRKVQRESPQARVVSGVLSGRISSRRKQGSDMGGPGDGRAREKTGATTSHVAMVEGSGVSSD